VVICGFELAEAGGIGRPKLVVTLRRKSGTRGRCGRCGVVAPWFDNGGPRTRRHVDIGFATSELVSAAPRMNCPVHGPTVIEVPWARHDS
jgi:transposase